MGEKNTRFKLRTAGLNSVEAKEETIILDELGEKYFSANPAGSLLWNALKDHKTSDELADLLVETFKIDRSTAATDVDSYINKLSTLDLIEQV